MKTTNHKYKEMLLQSAPKPAFIHNMFCAFWVGGAICTVGQLFLNIFLNIGIDKQTAGMLVSICLIGISGILTATGLYARLGNYAGAGTLVPITGFANAMISPAIEFKTEGWSGGICSRMFTIAGPVIVSGTAYTSLVGIFYYLLLKASIIQ